VFFYFPFLAVIPSALVFLSVDREEFVYWERLTYDSMAVLFVLGLAVVLFVIYLFFKRGDAERSYKFIAIKVIKRLAAHHVKSDYYTVDLVY
jgi:hypothetical protein